MSIGFACPSCQCDRTNVIDSRPRVGGGCRRRRICPSCQTRFTTNEMVVDDKVAISPTVTWQLLQLGQLLPGMASEDRSMLLAMAKRLRADEATAQTARRSAA